jgi:hypothetical protein
MDDQQTEVAEEVVETQPTQQVQSAPADPGAIGYKETDIFAWANNLFQYKEDLKFELFLISKNYVLYKAKVHAELEKQLQPLFVDSVLEYVLAGVEGGLIVRGFEDAESEENVLQRTRVERIEHLVTVMDWVHNQEHAMEQFSEEHGLKGMRGVLARCSAPGMKQTFYMIKKLPTAQLLDGEGTWVAKGNNFVPIVAGVLRIPSDNQLMILDDDLYVFNQAKLEQLFGYNIKKQAIAEKKVREIEENFKLSFADEMNLQTMVKGNKTLINKLQKVDATLVNQEQLLDHAEELGLNLMVDEEGAIIILSAKDLTVFVNLLNDDYVESGMTGNRYEIKSKKPLKIKQEDA